MIKNFLKQFGRKQEKKEEVFLALEIDNEKVISCLWQVKEGETEVLKIGSLEEWQTEDKQSLLLACDNSVSKVLTDNLKELKGIIFGLPENWVKKDQILPSYKNQLKLICEKLTLKPLGFVVSVEALVQFLKKEEGVPSSAILVKLEQTEVTVTLVKLGKIKGKQRVGRSEDLGADVEEALARLEEQGVLPSRILLFNGLVDFEEDRQQLNSFSWENLNFLHLPKVEILEPRTTIKAIAIAGGSEVAKSLGFVIKTESEVETEKPEDLGFVEGETASEATPPLAPTSFPEPASLKKEAVEKTPLWQNLLYKIKLPRLSSFLKKSTLFLPKKFKFSLIGGGILFFLSLFLLSSWRWQKAAVTLYLEPEVIEETLDLDLTAGASSSETEMIKVGKESVDVAAKKQVGATGTKLVGEEAQGEVTIYNKTASEVVLPEGTVLIGPEGLSFLLKEEVKIASASSEERDAELVTVYGKATVKTEAASIGAESNIEKDSKLTIKAYSQDEFSAKTETGFSGGTSREIQAVSTADMAKLKEELLKQLKEEANARLKEKIGTGRNLIEESLTEEVIKEDFSHQEGEETANLELDLKLKITGLVFSQEDLLSQAKKSLEGRIPEGMMISAEGVKTKILEEEFSEDQGKIKMALEIKLQSKIDLEEIKDKIKGKSLGKTEEILGEIPDLKKTAIKVSPNFPWSFNRLPYRKDNIEIAIEVL